MLVEAQAGVIALARAWSVAAPEETAARIALYMERLLEWNQRVNLTGAHSVEQLLGDHLPDSFALARLVPNSSDVVDVGSGGGLPALPFALLRPDCRITMVEARAKRVAFLNAAARACGCAGVRVVRSRIEEYEGPLFSVAVSRATFPPEEWLKLAPTLVVPGGAVLVLSTGEVSIDEGQSHLIDSVGYRTELGAARWAGCYRFT